MYLIYINDLVELRRKYNITVKLFADDVKLYVKVVNITDIDELQSAEKKSSAHWTRAESTESALSAVGRGLATVGVY